MFHLGSAARFHIGSRRDEIMKDLSLRLRYVVRSFEYMP